MDINQYRDRSISVLEQSLKLRGAREDRKKQQRLIDLIAVFEPFQSASQQPLHVASGWHFCVPLSFRPALDIQLTERVVKTASTPSEFHSTGKKFQKKNTMQWTQGSWFHFQAGDTLYDSPHAYQKWDLRNFGICLDIKKAASAEPPNKKNKTDRYPGAIIFDVLTPTEKHTELVRRRQTAMTQDEFIKLLIVGPPEDWSEFLGA